MFRGAFLGGIGLVTLVLLSGLSAAMAPSPIVAGATAMPAIGPGVTHSLWAGWIATTTHGHGVTDVRGSWIVPHIATSCKHPPTSTLDSVFVGIGMDGWTTTATAEYIGIIASCQAGSGVRQYQTFAEFYPYVLGVGSTFKVGPGNVISAEISVHHNRFAFNLTNLNTSKNYSYKFTNPTQGATAARTSAEWFVTGVGGYPLAPFGKVEFGPHWTHVKGSDSATIRGTTGPIGSFAPTVHTSMYVGLTLDAASSSLNKDKGSFFVDWKHF